MKKISKASELLWLLGIVFVAMGVSLCSKADLGVSMIAAPAFVVYEAVAGLWSGLSVGMMEYIIQGLLLVVMCLVIRRFDWRYLLAFAVAVLYGYTLNFFLWLLKDMSPDALWLRWLMLLGGDVLTAFGVACFFRTYMPLQVYELFVSELSSRFKLDITKLKWSFDMSLLLLSVVLALSLFGDARSFDWRSLGSASYHSIGLGTLVTTLINSPLIAMMGKLADSLFTPEPRFLALYRKLKIK